MAAASAPSRTRRANTWRAAALGFSGRRGYAAQNPSKASSKVFEICTSAGLRLGLSRVGGQLALRHLARRLGRGDRGLGFRLRLGSRLLRAGRAAIDGASGGFGRWADAVGERRFLAVGEDR